MKRMFGLTLADTRSTSRQRLSSVLKGIWEWRAGGEILLAMAILIIVEFALRPSGSLADMSPHPFWIAVLLVTVQHGSFAGLVTALVATGLVVAWVHPERDAVEDFYAYSTRLFYEPMLWFAAAIVLGSIRDQLGRAVAKLDSTAERFRDERQLIGEHCLDLRGRIDELEREISTCDASVLDGALRSLRALQNAPPHEVAERLRSAAELLLGPCTLSLSSLNGSEVKSEWICSGEMPAAVKRRPDTYYLRLLEAMVDQPGPMSRVSTDGAAPLEGAVAAIRVPCGGSLKPEWLVVLESLDANRITSEGWDDAEAVALEVLAGALAMAVPRSIPTKSAKIYFPLGYRSNLFRVPQ